MKALEGTDWEFILDKECKKPYFQEIGLFLYEQRSKNKTIYPDAVNYFRAFKECWYENTKVVIMGLDPYSKGEADGLAFSCNSEVIILPPSLKNIFSAIEESVYRGLNVEQDQELSRWAKQGVLLLNRYLTVERGMPESHNHIGWDTFTNSVISLLSAKTTPIVFILMGRKARSTASLITNASHLVIEIEHPAAASYNNRKWEYNDCFRKTNRFLEKFYGDGIEW